MRHRAFIATAIAGLAIAIAVAMPSGHIEPARAATAEIQRTELMNVARNASDSEPPAILVFWTAEAGKALTEPAD